MIIFIKFIFKLFSNCNIKFIKKIKLSFNNKLTKLFFLSQFNCSILVTILIIIIFIYKIIKILVVLIETVQTGLEF